MLIMKKQRNLSYHISILAFLFVISTVMVTSLPFQMLLDVNTSFKSTLSFQLANAADDKENSADVQEVGQEDVKDEESEQEFDQTSFEGFGGKDDAEDVEQEALTETEQEATDAEDVEQEDLTETEQEATDAEDVEQEAVNETEQETTEADEENKEDIKEKDQEDTEAEEENQ